MPRVNGLAALAEGDLDAAERLLAGQDDPRARLYRALVAEARGDERTALREAELAPIQRPGDVAAALVLTTATIAQPRGAPLGPLQDAAAAHANHPLHQQALLRALLARGRVAAAARRVAETLERVVDASAAYQARVMMLQAELAAATGEFSKVRWLSDEPLHTETVANIKGRDDIFCLLFFFLSIIWLYKYINENKFTQLAASTIFFFLSLLSKEFGVALFFLIPITLLIFTNSARTKSLSTYLPHFIAMIIFVAMRYSATVDNGGTPSNDVFNNPWLSLSFTDKYGTIFSTWLVYLRNMFVPLNMSYDYNFAHVDCTTHKFLCPNFDSCTFNYGCIRCNKY